LKKIINVASNENDIVLDMFMGVASTGVAARDLNRRFIGIEIDDIYYEACEKRMLNCK
jgi:site-specific DNA-methyltransferase (adenine-specific)/modification methylase